MANATIEPPKMLANGAEVFAYHHQHDGGNGYRPHGIVICKWREGEWVTWRAYRTEDGVWQAEQGRYFFDPAEAMDDFKDRAGIS